MDSRVLVVDDSATLRKVVSTILSQNGFDCLASADGQDALQLLEREHIDLILLDFVMPRMNGYQFCRELRARDAVRDMPVVLMSAKAERIRDQFLRQTGAIDAITKPFDARALVAVVEGALQRTAEGRAPKAPRATDMPEDATMQQRFESAPPSSAGALRAVQGPHARNELARVLAEMVIPAIQSGFPEAHLDPSTLDEVFHGALSQESIDDLLQRMRWLTLVPNAQDVLYGDIASIPIGEILQVLQMQRQSGVLEVSNRKVSVYIDLRDGLIDQAQCKGGPPEFLLGRYFRERSLVSDEALLSAVLEASDAKELLGEHMLAAGLISDEDLQTALTRQTSEVIYEVLRWQRGWFLLRRDAGTDEVERTRLSLPVASIVMEGFRRVDEWRLIEESIDFEETLYRDEAAISALRDATLTESERAVLDAIDGRRSVREIIEESHQSSFDICKTFYRFLKTRLVRRKVA